MLDDYRVSESEMWSVQLEDRKKHLLHDMFQAGVFVRACVCVCLLTELAGDEANSQQQLIYLTQC